MRSNTSLYVGVYIWIASLEILTEILRRILNYYSADSWYSWSKKILNQNPNQNALDTSLEGVVLEGSLRSKSELNPHKNPELLFVKFVW